MADKNRKKKNQAKRVNVEIAPGIQVLLDQYIREHNESPDRTRPPLTYTDVINQALADWNGALP